MEISCSQSCRYRSSDSSSFYLLAGGLLVAAPPSLSPAWPPCPELQPVDSATPAPGGVFSSPLSSFSFLAGARTIPVVN